MKKHDCDLLTCRVMIVACNLIETRSQVSHASSDSLSVTAADIAKIIGNSIDRIRVALRKLEAWGWLEQEVCADCNLRIRINRDYFNDVTGNELEISPELEAIVERFAERKCLTPEEAFNYVLKLGLKVEGLDIDEGLNKG